MKHDVNLRLCAYHLSMNKCLPDIKQDNTVLYHLTYEILTSYMIYYFRNNYHLTDET